MKILFVEDDEQISNLAKLLFVNTNHDVILSPTPECAIHALNNDRFDAVILDMNFPAGHGDGETVLSYILDKHIKIPVFIHSGYIGKYKDVMDHYQSKGIIKKVFDKPAKLRDMIQGINEIVNQ